MIRKWTVRFRERVEKKQIPKLPKKVKAILDEAQSDLGNEGPFPYGWNVKEIEDGKCRLWLKRKWRMVYTYEQGKLYIEVIYAGSKEGVPY